MLDAYSGFNAMPQASNPPSQVALMWQSLLSIVGLNLLVRAAWILNVHPRPISDFAFYFGAATRLAAGQGYTLNGQPTAYWPAGWPLALAALFRAFGSQLWVGLVFQLALTTAIAVLIALLAHRVSGSWAAATIAAAAWTLLPGELGWTSVLGTEPLFTLLTLAALYALTAGPDRRMLVLAGALLGAACWVRPTPLIFPVVLAVLFVIDHRGWQAAISKAALVLGVMLIVIAPLTLRNYAKLGAVVLVSTNGGVNLWQGVHTDTGYWWPSDPHENPLVGVKDEVERDRLGQRLFFQHAIAHPADVATHAVAKIASLYGPPSTVWLFVAGGWGERTAAVIKTSATIAYVVFMLAALLGIVWTWRPQRWATTLLLGFAAYYSAVWSVFPAWDRFRYPLMPIFAVFVGISAVRLWARVHGAQPADGAQGSIPVPREGHEEDGRATTRTSSMPGTATRSSTRSAGIG